MLSPLSVVLPIFALIFVGWLARRMGFLGAHATREINRFVVYLALPTLLFDIVVHARWSDLWQPGFIAAFGLGAALVFVVTMVVRLRPPRVLADAAIDGLNGAYANTGFVGFPLALAALGAHSVPLTLIASIVTVCLLFAAAIVLVEIGLQTEKRRMHLAMKVGRSLARNPLLVAPALGGLVALSGFAVPTPVESFLKLLGGAASPCALVALGLFLATRRDSAERTHGAVTLLVGFKLLLQPAVTWLLATLIFRLPPPQIHAAVLLAALPTGTGPFMLAELYRREAAVTSNVILVSTLLSVPLITAYLASIQ